MRRTWLARSLHLLLTFATYVPSWHSHYGFNATLNSPALLKSKIEMIEALRIVFTAELDKLHQSQQRTEETVQELKRVVDEAAKGVKRKKKARAEA